MRWNPRWLTRSVWSYLMCLRGPRKRQGSRKTQLCVEPLEDRYAPAVITPTTFQDGIGIGSLRDAVLQIDTNGQDNVIELLPGTYNLTLARGDASGVGGSLDLTGAGHTDVIEGAKRGRHDHRRPTDHGSRFPHRRQRERRLSQPDDHWR